MNTFSIVSAPLSLSRRLGPHLGLIGMVVMWGASWPAGRVLAQGMPPLAGASLRFVLACLVLLPWLYFSGRLALLKTWGARRWLGMVAAGAVGVFGYAALFLMGLAHLPASKATLLITLNPVVTLLAAVWLFQERVNRVIALGMLLAVVGAVVVISHGEPLQLLRGTALGPGELMILGCVLCWAAYSLIARQMLAGVDALTTTGVTSVVGTVLLLAATWAVEGRAGLLAPLEAGAAAWGAALFLGWGATAMAYGWYFSGVKALGVGAASGYITLVPVAGVVASALWLGEALDGSILAGGLMAVAGTGMMAWGRRPGSSASTRG